MSHRPPGYNHVALAVISLGYVRAFNPGDLIPDTTVAPGGQGETWIADGLAAPILEDGDESAPFDLAAAQAALQGLAPSATPEQLAAAEAVATDVLDASGAGAPAEAVDLAGDPLTPGADGVPVLPVETRKGR